MGSIARRSLMGSPFSAARAPDRWVDIKRLYPWGAFEQWMVERLFALLIIYVNDAIDDLGVRDSPRLALNGRARAKRRSLAISSGGVVRKRLTVEFDAEGVRLGDHYVVLDDEHGVIRLVNELLDAAERVWNATGR